MKTALYYFSGTGNSYAVAKKLQSELGDSRLIPITECVKNKNYELNNELKYDAVGLVFPLYFFSMPKAVMDFIENINLSGIKYIFAVITRGGSAWQGGALSHLKSKLKHRGYSLNAGFYVRMPDNFIVAYDIPSSLTREKYEKQSNEKINSIIPKIKTMLPIIEHEYSVALRPLVYHFYLKDLNKKDDGFFSDQKCNSCGLCEKICHSENINIEGGKPYWNHKCQFCLACIHYCPQKAIQYKKGTNNRQRYHHPDVPVSEYIKI
jgi:flavodoxin/Pyruvate/2-oxoacid:ferredoxin oxidoreductase delta subunit